MIFNPLRLTTFSVALLLFAFTSCSGQTEADCEKLNLSNEEASWFSNYANGDTIYFVSQEKEIDTFIIDVSTVPEYTTCNRFELGPYIYASQSVWFKSLDDYKFDEFDDGYFLGFDKVGQDSSNVNARKGMGFFDLNTGPFFDFNKVPKEEFVIPDSGQKIQIFVYTKNYNCSNDDGGKEIMQAFAISKEYGLIWYKTLEEKTYNRLW